MTKNDTVRCQKILKETRHEVRSYATLLSSIDNDCIDSKDLIGLGIHLERIHRKLGLISRLIDRQQQTKVS